MDIAIASTAMTAMLDHARAEHPREACGILLGTEGAITAAEPAANVAARPETNFEIDPAALLRAQRAARGSGQGIAGWYHSHPNGNPAPSATDAARAVEDGKLWLIVASGGVTAWRVAREGTVQNRFVSAPITIV